MIDATATTDPRALAAAAAAWLRATGHAADAEAFAVRAATVPGMDGMKQLCMVYHVPVRWSI